MSIVVLSRDTIGIATPLRLSIAAAVAIPGGLMAASGVRREERGLETKPLSHGAE
jgi:hypothetical protein